MRRALAFVIAVAACHRTPAKPDPDENKQDPKPVELEIPDSSAIDVAEVPDSALVDACVSTTELLRVSGRSDGVLPQTPAIDLDGDGKFDPLYRTPGSPEVLVWLFVEKGGCAREIGAITYTLSGSLRVIGRDKQGFAILLGTGVRSMQTDEERAEYDGTRYVTMHRTRLWTGSWEPWSPWTKNE
jgi:hypothetical protein